MKVFGYFASQKGDIYKVEITINGNGADIEIKEDADLQFAAEDIVVIDSGVDDSLDVVQQHTCTIALQAKRYIDSLFAKEYKDAKVEISRVVSGYGSDEEKTVNVFSGWLEPRTLSQPFNEVYDDLSLQCVDCLSAMQYSPFRGVGVTTTYTAAAQKAGMSTFKALLNECLTAGCGSLDGVKVYYDGSKALDNGSAASGTEQNETTDIFASLSVNDMIFLGDDEDDTKTCLDVVEDVLKFLNLHIVQYGKAFYIFSWESIRKVGVTWTEIILSGDAVAEQQHTEQMDADAEQAGVDAGQAGVTVISEDNVEDDGAQIDVTEIFNQISLTVSTKKDSTAVVTPLDSSGKVPVMGPRRPYVTEFAADGEGISAAKCFWSLVNQGKDLNNYDGERVYKDYYVRVLRNVHWNIGAKGIDWAQEQADKDNTAPNTVVTKLSKEMGALLLSVGTVDHKPGKGDDSPQTTISMSDWLVVSVNGNGDDNNPLPGESELQAAAPVAEYTGGSAGASYSPAEEGATNYLVIDGTLILNPIMAMSDTIDNIDSYKSADDFAKMFAFGGERGRVVPSRNNGDGRYLTFGWWQHAFGMGNAYFPAISGYSLIGTTKADIGWIPYTTDGPEQYEYKAKGDDTISKVGVLECMLTIGDGDNAMVLVEDMGDNGEKDGAMSRLSWKKYKTLEECKAYDEYYAQSFAIGINPKKGDKIIGTEFDIATNFDYNTNISAEKGMAIPLPHDAKLSGRISLKILGPVNEWWDDNVRRHRTWFRREKWTTNSIPLLAHISSIIVKSMTIKMYTPTEDSGDDSDVVYMSKTSHKFYNKKDDLEFEIHSGFTQAEISKYSLSDSALRGTVCGPDNLPLLNIKDENTGNVAKAEKIYVDAAYQEMHLPRIVLTQNMQYKGGGISPFGLFRHEALRKNFYVRDMGANLGQGSVQMKLEECF